MRNITCHQAGRASLHSWCQGFWRFGCGLSSQVWSLSCPNRRWPICCLFLSPPFISFFSSFLWLFKKCLVFCLWPPASMSGMIHIDCAVGRIGLVPGFKPRTNSRDQAPHWSVLVWKRTPSPRQWSCFRRLRVAISWQAVDRKTSPDCSRARYGRFGELHLEIDCRFWQTLGFYFFCQRVRPRRNVFEVHQKQKKPKEVIAGNIRVHVRFRKFVQLTCLAMAMISACVWWDGENDGWWVF